MPSVPETLARDLLALCEMLLAARAPDRSLISPATPVIDCCLTGESLVSTVAGPVPIRDVKAGDLVWAFEDGHLVERRIIGLKPQGVQPVFRLRGHRRQVVATADHPMLRLNAKRANCHARRPQEWETEWVPLGDLVQDDILVSLDHLDAPEGLRLLPDGTPLSADAAWLFGVWAGDGCFNDINGICLFIHGALRERARETVQRLWGIAPKENSERIEINSRELYELFAGVFPRVRAHDKRVPQIIWEADPAAARAFLDGYAAADGHSVHGRVEYAAASPQLIEETRMLHIGLGDAVTNVLVKERTKPITIRGVQVKNARPLYRYSYYPNGGRRGSQILDYRKARRALPDKRLGVSTVRSIEPMGEQETFDIEVEGAHNFIANGLVVHNCPLLAVHVAGGRLEATWGSGQLDSFTQGKGPSASSLQLVITIVRCTPKQDVSGNPPLAADIEAATAETLEDLWALWHGLGRAIRDGDILSRCQGARFDTITPIAETGGCAGWQIPLTISGPAG